LAEAAYLRLRKNLREVTPAPEWPPGVRPAAFETIDPRPLHTLLCQAFPGAIGPFEDWYRNLTADSEFDPALCVAAVAVNGEIAGFVQCWTSDFVKDLAVSPDYRSLGLGTALMREMFSRFAGRGATFVDLKVGTENHGARRLYARLGMVEVAV
jgi:ribosomal protein S18 acetylase RimI-like enzyme